MDQQNDSLSELGIAVIDELTDSLERHNDSIHKVQESLAQKLGKLRAQITALEENVNCTLEKSFVAEEERRQKVVTKLREWLSKLDNSDSLPPEEARAIEEKVKKWTKRAQAELLVEKSYKLVEGPPFKRASPEREEHEREGGRDEGNAEGIMRRNERDDEENLEEDQERATDEKDFTDLYKVLVTSRLSLEHVCVDAMKDVEVSITKIQNGKVFYKVGNIFGPYGDKVVKEQLCKLAFTYRFMLYEKGKDDEGVVIMKEDAEGYIDLESVKPDVSYCLKCKILLGEKESEWSKAAEFKTGFAECCRWTSFDPHYPKDRFYRVHEENPRVVSTDKGLKKCMVTGNITLPADKVVRWGIRILKTELPTTSGLFIGVGPADIVAQKFAHKKERFGWYLVYDTMKLRSGPPHNYKDVNYGSRKVYKGPMHSGPTVCLTMDMKKGELSFTVDGINFGTAFEGIPLDKPLVPYVRFRWGDTYEIVPEISNDFKISADLPAPSGIVSSSREWDSALVQWSPVPGALLYQIEINGSSFLSTTKKPFHEIRGLFPGAEFSLRVRSVAKNKASAWSSVVKGIMNKDVPPFSACVWKKCHDERRGYALKEGNPRIAMIKERHSDNLLMGTSPVPLNQVVRWSVKLLRIADCDDVIIGVIPTTFNPRKRRPFIPVRPKSGWFLNCHMLRLCSGPPHKYVMKEYVERAMREHRSDEYVHEGDLIGVVMDTTKGELSFSLNGKNLGVAYEGIPLDEPLVPCVLLRNGGDSVELII